MSLQRGFVFCAFIGIAGFFLSACDVELMNLKGFLEEMPPEEILAAEVSPCVEGDFSPYCMAFCHAYPLHPTCERKIDYCVFYPDSPECLASCIATPFDKTCAPPVDCTAVPEDPACVLYCSTNPPDPVCETGPDLIYVSHSDSFQQIANSRTVDIVWIIDNSSSMEDEQAALADNFDRFIDSFLITGADFKMGVTTTDTTGTGGVLFHDGEFLGTTPVLSSSMGVDAVRTAFMENIQVGIDGSFLERGLLAAEMAVQKNTDNTSVNFDFLRGDAFLAVIVVSDENDISPASTESYMDSVLAVKSDPTQVAFYSIVDTLTSSLPDPWDSPIDMPLYISTSPNPGGLRYMNVANATGGGSLDIHDDFAESLMELGGWIVSLINRYQLKEVPALDSVVLRIDGLYVPHGIVDGWSYDPETLSLRFNGRFIPPVGSFVEIKYKHRVIL